MRVALFTARPLSCVWFSLGRACGASRLRRVLHLFLQWLHACMLRLFLFCVCLLRVCVHASVVSCGHTRAHPCDVTHACVRACDRVVACVIVCAWLLVTVCVFACL